MVWILYLIKASYNKPYSRGLIIDWQEFALILTLIKDIVVVNFFKVCIKPNI